MGTKFVAGISAGLLGAIMAVSALSYTPPVSQDGVRANGIRARTAGSDVTVFDSDGNVLGRFADTGTVGDIKATRNLGTAANSGVFAASGDITLGAGATANSVTHIQAGSAGAALTTYADVNLNGITLQNSATIYQTSGNVILGGSAGTSKVDGTTVILGDATKTTGGIQLTDNTSGGPHSWFDSSVGVPNWALGINVGSTLAANTVTKIFSANSGSISPAAVTAATCGNYAATITVTGAAAGDPCVLGSPAGGPGPNLMEQCYVSSANTVSIRACNPSAANQTPTVGTRTVFVMHH